MMIDIVYTIQSAIITSSLNLTWITTVFVSHYKKVQQEKIFAGNAKT